MALAQFEGTLVLVSHDRHLLRASTEQLVLVRDGRVEAFDGDLDDYRLALLNRKVQPAPAPTPAPVKPTRQKPVSKKNLQSRIQRLEEHMKRLGGEIATVEKRYGHGGNPEERRLHRGRHRPPGLGHDRAGGGIGCPVHDDPCGTRRR